jgi:hypothetical protein
METRRWLLLATIAAAACGGYTAPDEVTFGASVYSQPDPKASFAPLRTFFLDPKLENWADGVQQTPTDLPGAASTPITTRMTQYGYTQVGAGNLLPPSTADVGMKLVLVNNSYTYYYSYCGAYWYGWYGCWPTWGYGGSYSTGTVLVVMADLRAAPPPAAPPGNFGQRPILWVSALYAVLQGTTANQANLTTALNRAFDQSPYLKTSAP